MLNYGAYENWIQSRLVQAQYWHDPLVSNKIIFWGNLPGSVPYRQRLIEIAYHILFHSQDEETYRKYSQFLSGINNAKESKNQT